MDHGKCQRFDEYVLLDGVPVTGPEIMDIALRRGVLITRIDNGELYKFDHSSVVSINERFEPVKAASLFYVERYSGPICSIKSRTGRTLAVTPMHPLLANRKGKIEWIRARDLRQDDYIAFLSHVPLSESITFNDPLPLLGETYHVVTWEDFLQLKIATSNFEHLTNLSVDEFEKLRILRGLPRTELCRRAHVNGGTYNGMMVAGKPIPLPVRERLARALQSANFENLRPNEFMVVKKSRGVGRIRKLRHIELDSDLVKWFAFVWSEGSSRRNFVSVTQKVQKKMLREFLRTTREKLRLEYASYEGGQYRVFNTPFIDYLRFKFDFKPGNESVCGIASWVCRLPVDLKATFLRWFLTLDGEFDQHSGQIMVAQLNHKNIVLLSYLLHSFGIIPRFGVLQRNTKKGRRKYYRLMISGRQNLEEFGDSIGFEDSELHGKLRTYLKKIKRATKETNLSIPIDVSSLRTLFKEIGLRREAFDRTPGIPIMKGSVWYKAYEGAVRTGRISRSKLALVVQSIDDQLKRIEDSLPGLRSLNGQHIRRHLELVGISLEMAAGELGTTRKILTRILRRGTIDELRPLITFLLTRTEMILSHSEVSAEQLRLLSRTMLEFDRITSIKVEDYDGLVYDLSVPEYANFVGGTGAIICHNTSIVQSITGVWASAHSEELRRGITIKVGYADAAFYRCPEQDPPAGYSTSPECPIDGKPTKLLRAVSFVDAPGHESLMTNMLAGAFLMDGALLVIASNEPVPRPQTREHLQALQMLGMKKIVVVQNKIDLVTDDEARKSYGAIEDFVANTVAEKAPIIPVSAQQRINIDALIEAIEEVIPTPKREPAADALMYVVRSFDVNRPGTDISELHGGVLGGSLTRGEMQVGDEIEMRPGMPDERSRKYIPVNTKVYSLGTGAGITSKVGPGGLVAVGTEIDPAFTKNDQMVGSVIGKPGSLPPVWEHVTLDHELFESVVGSAEPVRVEKIRVGEGLRLNLGTASTLANATSVRDRAVELELKKPVCIEEGARAAISRRIAERWRLIGSGVLK